MGESSRVRRCLFFSGHVDGRAGERARARVSCLDSLPIV